MAREPGTRRPVCATLYDVFFNICEDEAEHVSTMKACQQYAVDGPASKVESPHVRFRSKVVTVPQSDQKVPTNPEIGEEHAVASITAKATKNSVGVKV